MTRIGGASLRMLLAVTLAVGLMPSMAYAADGESQLDDGRAAEKPVEQAPASDGFEQDDSSPDPEGDDSFSDSNLARGSADDLSPKDEPAPPIEEESPADDLAGAPSIGTPKANEAPSDSDSPAPMEQEAAAASVETPFGALSLDQPVSIVLQAGEAALLSFTAPNEGRYLISSSGSYDTIGFLFADKEMAEQLAYDDDGGSEGNFSISYWLSAGQTVYLKARPYKETLAASFSVSASLDRSFDLSEWSNAWISDASLADGSFVAPEAHFLKWDSATGATDELAQGKDFEIVGYLASDGETPLEGQPERSGAYYVEMRGLAPYYGSAKMSFWVSDNRDLSNGTLEASSCAWAGTDGFEAPTLLFMPGSGSDTTSLVPGEHYRIIGFQDAGGASLEYNPVDAGWYSMQVEGIAPYYGEASVSFEARSLGDIVNLAYDTPTNVSFNEGQETYFSFTAPNDGLFAFSSFGACYNTGLSLYADRSMNKPLGGMDGGCGIGDVSIAEACIQLAAGQTVYLKVWGWGGIGSVLASDGGSLEHAFASVSDEGVVSKNSFKAPALNVYSFDAASGGWQVLTPGTDYQISGYLDANGNPIDGEPTEAGSYIAVIQGIGAYHANATVPFDALSDRDVRFFSFSVDGYLVASGEPIVEPAISGYRYDDEGVLEAELVQNRDFRIVGYRGLDGDALEVPPYGPGEYIAIVGGMGEYLGSQDVFIQVYDPKDYSVDSVSGIESVYEYTGEPVVVSPTVTAFDGTTLWEGVDYTVEYEDDRGAALSGPPVEPGSYYLTIRPIGHPVGAFGFQFEIVDPCDIGGDAYWDTYLSGSNILLHTGSPVILPEIVVRRDVGGDTLELVLGTDFRIKSFATSNDELLDGPPVEVGSYRVILEGIGRYTGERAVEFSVKSPYDIAAYNINSRVPILTDGAPISDPSIDAYLYDDNGFLVELVQNRDFRIAGYRDGDGNVLEGAPSEPGNYVAIVEGIGDYFGEQDVWIEVWNPYDIGSFSAWVSGYVVSTGEPVEEPCMEVVRFGDEGLPESRLVQNRDFHVKGYEDSNGSALEGAPWEPGEYRVILEGIGDYFGEISVYLPVENSKDLRFARVDLEEHEYQYTSEAVSLALTVTAYDGSLLREGEHYRVVFFANDDYDRSHPLPEVPSEVGDYVFAVEAIEDGEYTGTAGDSWHFAIYDEFDLSTNGWASISGSLRVDGRDVFLYAGESITPSVYVFANGDYGAEGFRRLVEGVDYELSYAGNVGPFDGETEATATVTGIGKYHGSLTESFTIVTSLDLSFFVNARGVRIGWGTDWRSYDRASPEIEFFATGEPIMPSIQLNGLPGASFAEVR